MGEIFVPDLLQVKLLVARSAFCMLGTNLAQKEDSTNRLTFGTKARCDVFWGGSNYLLSFSASHIPIWVWHTLLNLSIKRGGWDLNPRVLADMGLAIPRPTRLGDPRSRVAKVVL